MQISNFTFTSKLTFDITSYINSVDVVSFHHHGEVLIYFLILFFCSWCQYKLLFLVSFRTFIAFVFFFI